MGSRGLAPLRGVLKGGGAAPFFSLTVKMRLLRKQITNLSELSYN